MGHKIKSIYIKNEKGWGWCEAIPGGYEVKVEVEGNLVIELNNGEKLEIPVSILAIGDDTEKGRATIYFDIKIKKDEK
jgi:hypothetical protein